MKIRNPNFLRVYDDGPCAVIPGWQIKEAQAPYTPVAVVSAPRGGREACPSGFDRQDKNARLLTAAPRLLKALRGLKPCGGPGGLNAEAYARRVLMELSNL